MKTVAGQRYYWGPAWEEYYSRFWDEAMVINKIRAMAREGVPIYLAAVAAKEEWHLIRAASYYFGSWRDAVEAAGFDYEKVRGLPKWNREKVVKAIRALKRRGEDLNSRAVQIAHPALFAAAIRDRLSGSWDNALKAAGISTSRARKYEHWDVERIRTMIGQLERSRVPLHAKSVHAKNSHLYYAACKRYGSWGAALKALGYDPKTIALRRTWTRTEIARELKRLRKKGVHLSDNCVRDHDIALS